MAGKPINSPYTLNDMAADTIGLMDVLGISRAHIVGASMGGMIAQIIAAHHQDRTKSLTSVMSSSGDPKLPPATAEAMAGLLAPRPRIEDREKVILHGMNVYRAIGSPGFPTPARELRAKVERAFERSYYPNGVGRQFLAILASGSRVEMLRCIKVPSLVIHGAEDPLVPLEAGRDTAKQIPGAKLKVISGMGHDLATGLVPVLVDAIADHCLAVDKSEIPQGSR